MANVEQKLPDSLPDRNENITGNGPDELTQPDDSLTEPVGGDLPENVIDSADANSEDIKKPGKRVKFPDGDGIILAYHEHPSPWHAASECTPESLVAAYKEACAKLEVKPLPKLLQQLHAIANFDDRNETLTLRGERLDHKHCETLEEVLRRVQFRTIDLEATHLDDESAIALFDMIEYYHSAIRVNISYNKLGVRGWQSCSRMLKKTACITQLDARCCTVLDQVMPVLGRAIRMGSQVAILHLENSVASGRSLMILVAAIKMNEPLRELYLADNKLMPTDGIQLGNLLKFNHRLTLLDVRNNHLGDVGAGHIFDGLCEQTLGTGLQTLVLWNNQLSYQIMHSLSRSLRLTQSLETINLGHNSITNEGVHRLKEAMLFNKTLLRIGLQSAKLSCEGAVALAECVAESTRLLRLDLRENDVKTGGLMALSLALKVNQSVTRIDLDQKPKRESSVRDYAEQQQRLLQDIVNYSQRNRTAGIQREQEERQRRLEQELRTAMQEEDAVCHSDEEDIAVEANEMIPQTQENIFPNTNTINDQITPSATSTVQTTPTSEPQSNTKTPSALPLKLSLNLPVMPRCASLESPVDAPTTEFPQVDVPPTVHEETHTDFSPIADYPPSPMVSSEGKTILAAALAESAQENVTENDNISEQSKGAHQASNGNVPQISLPPLEVNVSASPMQSEIVRPLSPGQCPSPNSRRKFTIRRVFEPSKPVTHSASSESTSAAQSSPDSPHHVSASDSTVVVTDVSTSSKTLSSSAICSGESSQPVEEQVSSEPNIAIDHVTSDKTNTIPAGGDSAEQTSNNESSTYPSTKSESENSKDRTLEIEPNLSENQAMISESVKESEMGSSSSKDDTQCSQNDSGTSDTDSAYSTGEPINCVVDKIVDKSIESESGVEIMCNESSKDNQSSHENGKNPLNPEDALQNGENSFAVAASPVNEISADMQLCSQVVDTTSADSNSANTEICQSSNVEQTDHETNSNDDSTSQESTVSNTNSATADQTSQEVNISDDGKSDVRNASGDKTSHDLSSVGSDSAQLSGNDSQSSSNEAYNAENGDSMGDQNRSESTYKYQQNPVQGGTQSEGLNSSLTQSNVEGTTITKGISDIVSLNGINVDIQSNGSAVKIDDELVTEAKTGVADTKDEFEKELEEMLAVAFSN